MRGNIDIEYCSLEHHYGGEQISGAFNRRSFMLKNHDKFYDQDFDYDIDDPLDIYSVIRRNAKKKEALIK